MSLGLAVRESLRQCGVPSSLTGGRLRDVALYYRLPIHRTPTDTGNRAPVADNSESLLASSIGPKDRS